MAMVVYVGIRGRKAVQARVFDHMEAVANSTGQHVE